MSIPQYLYGSNEEIQRYFALLVQQLQTSLSDQGWQAPQLTSAEVTVVTNGTVSPTFLPVLPAGTFWYNVSVNALQLIVMPAVPGTSNAVYVTLATGGGVQSWVVVTTNTVMSPNVGYMTSSGGQLVMTLPVTAAVGSIIRITNLGGTFKVAQNIGQSINFGDDTTTIGVGGNVTCMDIGDTLELVCYFANSGFQVISSMGNFIVT